MPIKVLVADDSPTIRRRAAATLSEAGYEVTCVDSGEAAWALLEAGDACAVLLCDILMPGMDGYELCRLVKSDARLANLPVLLLRGTFEPWDQAKAENVGADGFITKPFDANALLSTLSEVVSELVPAASSSGGATMSEGYALAEAAAAASQPAPRAEASVASADPLGEPLRDPLGDPLADPLGGGDDSPLAAASPAGAEPLGLGDDPFSLGDEPPPAPMPAQSAPAPAPAAAPVAVAVVVPAAPARTAPAPEPAPAPRPEPLRAPTPAAAPVALATAPTSSSVPSSVPAGDIDDAMLDRLAARVIARLTTQQIEKIAWEVVPDVAEALIKKRLFEIESKLAPE